MERLWCVCAFSIVAFTSTLMTGCFKAEQREAAAPGSPILATASARDVRGLKPGEVYIEAKDTVADVPLTTQLIRRVAGQSRASVVSIYVKTETPYRLQLLPFEVPGLDLHVTAPGIGLGSGFFIHPSGYLLTNNHVVRDATQIMALTHDEKELALGVVARDPASDLALLKVIGSKGGFTALAMGRSDAVAAGDMVVAVGNPLGLGHTVTSGIISQTGRDLSGVADDEAARVRFLQTDAAINPGSSGGPVITLAGAWVGVATAVAKDAQGIGFAVPSSQVKRFLDKVLAGEGQ